MADASLVGMLGRLAVSLAVVFGLMALLAAYLRRRGTGGLGISSGGANGSRRRTSVIDVVARQALGRTASVAVVRTAGRALVLGVTDSKITVLAEADASALETGIESMEPAGTPAPVGANGAGTAWTTFVDALRERTLRRP
jgi:flagellar protein FliO/FliZ